jgi:Flp pilus assembly protein TadG
MLRFAGKMLTAQFARVRTPIANFRADARANVAIITAISAIPVLTAIGCVVDYSMASMINAKLQAAADAAALATVSSNSPIVASAKLNGNVAAGSTYATNFFNADVTAINNSANMNVTPTSSVTMSGTTITTKVSFTAQIPTYFLGLLGHKNILLNGSSTASFTLPSYIDFYLMLDVSGSMSFPSTTSEQQRLMAVNPDNLNGSNGYPSGCQFACHFTAQGACPQSSPSNPFQGSIPAVGTSRSPGTNPSPGGYCQGFIISRLGTTPTSFASGTTNARNGNSVNWSNTAVSTCATAGTTSCIQLRADAVGYAVNALLTTANSTESNDGINNQFRVGLFPFIQNLCYSNVGSSNSCSVGLTTSLTGSTISNFATQLANLLDTGQNTTLGSGGTHFENALNTMNNTVIPNPVGTGTSTNPLPYLFIVTDGSQDYQTQSGGNWGSQNYSSTSAVPNQNSATVIPPNTVTKTDYCTTIKNRGITVAILYIPYGTILDPNANFANNEDGYANSNIPNIPAALQTCASPNFFYTASTPTDIQNALVTMFQQAVSTAHITH